jgi:hypothetical protein
VISQKASGVAKMSVNTVRSSQITTSSRMVTGISVDRMHGMEAEKKRMEDTERTALRIGQIRAVIAVTRKVTSRVVQKYIFQYDIRFKVLATMIIKVAETVEKPVAIMTASWVVYFPSLYNRLVIRRAME